MKKLITAIFLLGLISSPALADNCSAYPYTLQNGQTADANQVMANFNNVLSCGNNNLLGKNANLGDVQSTSSSRANLGIGTAGTQAASGSTGTVASVSSASSGNLASFSDNNGTVANSGIGANDVLTKSGNLAGIGSQASAQANLGLFNGATTQITASTSSPSGVPSGGAGSIWLQYVP